MARMDMRLRRDAPGMSVFWMILIVGAGVFVLLAIVLMSSGGETVVEHDDTQIIAGEGDEPPGTSSFSGGEVADQESTPTDGVAGEAAELDEAVPESGEADDTEEAGTVGAVDADPAEQVPGDEDAGANAPEVAAEVAEATGEPAAEETEATEEPAAAEADATAEPAAEDAETSEGGGAESVTEADDAPAGPIEPTPSGPEGRDDEVILEDEEAPTE